MSNISCFAPIIIPTLCRYDHFKACVESLKRNSGVAQTDLYIGLDYPAKESHWVGYRKIDEYLKSLQGFRSVNVFRREENFGAARNLRDLLMRVKENHDRYILTEDDNIFSPNFLEFVNGGLERYKDDKSIFAICGYRHFYSVKYGDNNYYLQNADFSAWGYGTWFDRREEMERIGTNKYFRRHLLNPFVACAVLYRGINQLHSLYAASKPSRGTTKPLNFPDGYVSVYMYLRGMYCVMPVVSKVRNNGFDGSGLSGYTTSELEIQHREQQIDGSDRFVYQGEDKFISHNRRVYRVENYGNKLILRSYFSRLRKFLFRQ